MSTPSSSFFNAVRGGHLTAVRLLLKADTARVKQMFDGRTAMHIAARNGFAEICRELASFGADLDAIDSEGYGPLHRAARHGHVDVCLVLCELGATISLDPVQKAVPPKGAMSKHSRRTQVGTALHVAAKNNQGKVCEVLVVKLKAPVNATTIDGVTPLHKVRPCNQTNPRTIAVQSIHQRLH
jgi:ankyrin repeat protein